MAGDIRNRLGAHNLDAAQVTAFRSSYQQMMAISDNRGYQSLAGLHGVPNWYCWHHQQNARSAQQMQLFLPWHRAYLYNWEMAMRDRVAGVTLPWWDWTLRAPRQDGLPGIFTETLPAGAANPLLAFSINLPGTRPPVVRPTTRAPDTPDALPAQADVDDCLASTDWTDFNLKLEDIHDRVHGWVSGDMGVVGTAAYDPIFWSHHAMIDRIWSMWQSASGNVPPDLLDVVLAPFNMKVRDVLDTTALGYEYAAAQSSVAIGGTS